MNGSRWVTVVLIVGGLAALAVGGGLLIAPEGFQASSGIDLGGDVDLLSETRAPGAALAGLGAVMVAGALVARLRHAALVVATVLYLSYGAGRLVSWTVDGTPHAVLAGATIAELVIGAAAAWALVTSRPARPAVAA